MIHLDAAWMIQMGILQAQHAAENRNLDCTEVRTWMTRSMWKQLCKEIQMLHPESDWDSLNAWEKEDAPIERVFCGSRITIVKGKRMIAISAHPRFMGGKKK